MAIIGLINGIKYQPLIKKELKTVNFNQFNINDVPSSCIVKDELNDIAVSKWVSPKRTRSYPYARVYDTIQKNKRVTVIPVVKDEGLDGDRDFIQWDTVCLMSLLEVSVIFAYYDCADKNTKYENKVTNLKFNNEWVKSKIKELSTYQSSALHWNLKEIRENLENVVNLQIDSYAQIATKTGVTFHSHSGLVKFQDVITNNVEAFMTSSRTKAQQAQSREVLTTHSGEKLETLTKSALTITNYLGGQYFFTVDEVGIQENVISLIESKHTRSNLLPSQGDIKDGLLKMILYSNLSHVSMENKDNLVAKPILKLTSPQIQKNISSDSQDSLLNWCQVHNLKSLAVRKILMSLFEEAHLNQFTVTIEASQ